MNSRPKVAVSYFFGPASVSLGSSCARALQALGCEVLCFDSGTDNPISHFLLKPFQKTLSNIGLKEKMIFRESRWNVQNYRQRLLEKSVSEFRPDILLVLRGHGFDGEFLRYLKGKYCIGKTVGWWVKGPKWFDLMLSEARVYDHFFCIHKEGYTSEDGIIHLPALAVDDILYRQCPGENGERYAKNSDIVFVGAWTRSRQDIIQELAGLPVAIYGPKWLRENSTNRRVRKMIKAQGIWGDELVRLYNGAKIALNISQWDTSSLSGLNLRIFDIPACGTFLLTDYSDDLQEYFAPGEEIETFRDIQELKDKLSFYLRNDSARERIALRGYDKVRTLGTYRDKMAALLDTVWRSV